MKLCIGFLLCLAPLLSQSDDLATRSHRAKELMAAGRFQEAIPIYSDLVKALPNNPGLIMSLGLALHMAGREGKAISQFEAVLKLDPRHVPAKLFLGSAYVNLGEPAKAIEPLEKVIHAQPDNHDAREILAEAFLSLGRYEQAAEHFKRLSELEPENPKAWNGLGLGYEALGRRNFEELEKIVLGSAYWLVLVAESRARAQQYSSAFYLYRQALAKMPTLRGVHAGLGEIYRKTGHPDWAATEEDRERRLGPPDCNVENLQCDFLDGRYLELLASAKRMKTAESYYWESRAYDKLAIGAFSHLGQLAPSAELHELMARIHNNQRQYREAAEEWREALKLSPKDSQIERQLAIALKRTGDNQGARERLEELLKREPNSAELNYLFGDTLLSLQQPEKGVPFLEKAVEHNPTLWPAHSSLARAYLQIGQAGRAIPHLKAALPIDEDGSLHYQLARAYQMAGQQQLAQKTLKDYQNIRNAATAENRQLEQEVQITPP